MSLSSYTLHRTRNKFERALYKVTSLSQARSLIKVLAWYSRFMSGMMDVFGRGKVRFPGCTEEEFIAVAWAGRPA
jgi:hypothetical protein